MTEGGRRVPNGAYMFPQQASLGAQSGAVAVRISQGADGRVCPPIQVVPNARWTVDMLPPCAQALATNCSQIYLTTNKGQSWASAAANVGLGDAFIPYHPGADPRDINVIDTCIANAPPTSASCDRITLRLFENGTIDNVVTVKAQIPSMSAMNTTAFDSGMTHFVSVSNGLSPHCRLTQQRPLLPTELCRHRQGWPGASRDRPGVPRRLALCLRAQPGRQLPAGAVLDAARRVK